MTCAVHSGVSICRATPVLRRSVAGVCLDCKKPTRFLTIMYEWYGPDATCVRCGRRWSDGEWMPLTFERHARRRSIKAAVYAWRRAATDNPPAAPAERSP